MHELIQKLNDWYNGILDQWGCWAVALLMAAESTIVPIPSEVIIPPAAYKAWQDGIDCFGFHATGWTAQIFLVLAGAVGSWFGATIMYWVARLAGRPLVLRYGKYFLLPAHKVEAAERWAANYGPFGIFAARLLPVVRHLIGLPAGIVRMNFFRYSIYTFVGSALWCVVLCWLGVNVGDHISHGEMHKVTLWLGAFLVIVGVIYYFFVHRHMAKRNNK